MVYRSYLNGWKKQYGERRKGKTRVRRNPRKRRSARKRMSIRKRQSRKRKKRAASDCSAERRNRICRKQAKCPQGKQYPVLWGAIMFRRGVIRFRRRHLRAVHRFFLWVMEGIRRKLFPTISNCCHIWNWLIRPFPAQYRELRWILPPRILPSAGCRRTRYSRMWHSAEILRGLAGGMRESRTGEEVISS